jgi:RNA polymerase sigma-70 factor (ECF subfamily)
MTIPGIDLQDLALKYRGYLWALASASLGTGFRNQLDPADVVQTTLLRAAESLATSPVSDEESLLAWLRQVLKSVLVDEYRRLHRDRRDIRREQQLLESGVDASAAGLQACLAADQTSPSLAAVRNERLLLLADALVQLPAEQAAVWPPSRIPWGGRSPQSQACSDVVLSSCDHCFLSLAGSSDFKSSGESGGCHVR